MKPEEELVLISPYIKADNETKDILKNQKRSTKIHVIYGKTRLKPTEKSFFNDISIEPSFLENLHAKCYLNEREVLLTSMNLYEFSQEHNDEMGILVSSEQEPELYNKIREEGDEARGKKRKRQRNFESERIPIAFVLRRRRDCVSGVRLTFLLLQPTRTVTATTPVGDGTRMRSEVGPRKLDR